MAKTIRRTGCALLLALVFSSCTRPGAAPAASVAAAPPLPSHEFLALDLIAQNLATYDAVWAQIDSNHYDAQLFRTPEWQQRRAGWRKEAASATSHYTLYHNIFPRLFQLMPESHVELVDPPLPSNRDPAPAASVDKDTITQLATLKIYGPGFDDVEIRRGNHRVKLVGEVWPDAPAVEAGVSPGARIINTQWNIDAAKVAIHVNTDFVPLNTLAARAWEQGTDAILPPAESSIVRARFDIRPIRNWRRPFETRKLERGVRYLRFDGFGDDAFMKPVFEAVDDAGPAGIIVDLRTNIGGDSDQLKKFAGVFLGANALVSESQDRQGHHSERATGSKYRYTGPLVVLIGPRSASAAELFAAAIQDRKRGLLIGRSTNGSVLAAKYFPLPDGGYVMVPIANLWREAGGRIEGIGVEPDTWMLPTLEDIRAGRDPVLERALQMLYVPH